MTKKEKRLKVLKEKLSFYEGKLYRHMFDYQPDLTESIFTKVTRQDVIILNVAIEDLRQKIDKLES
ncbi:hypothetical protein A3D78_00470 [Candidatus Gottesmanbacteria bacterium RIFCSPHIGHO2_02_FULL_39_14]|uniref:Uncharacterized protein n=3 Tax=Candidatus Gottesmaniibacteriota TaxID=1752720 RepID=A0A1F5ZUE5_9BACT|nr:MAG: hypothetical protein A2153_05750 [Candidatus Gottesmanbacteria bacterium RBG_16_38_7b]OGG16106.1 MAG: hypothetical protein A3D78_00470 [Candidatus Gottesmanbacteria bacterium RIFCSPHIGHO2_02_FULL_39_14]OGG31974.1 MAG: hypothetical protein A3I51_04355 [Candidatus Gottesmanbacteria bacterium RIFCSPLOWO2_02_FULL_38_8]